MYNQKDHQGCTDANGEAQDIDNGKNLIAAEIPEGDNQPVFEHMEYLLLLLKPNACAMKKPSINQFVV